MARLYEYAILVQEKRDNVGNLVQDAELIKEPSYLIAKDDVQATIAAGKEVPDELKNDAERYDRMVLIVRPF